MSSSCRRALPRNAPQTHNRIVAHTKGKDDVSRIGGTLTKAPQDNPIPSPCTVLRKYCDVTVSWLPYLRIHPGYRSALFVADLADWLHGMSVGMRCGCLSNRRSGFPRGRVETARCRTVTTSRSRSEDPSFRAVPSAPIRFPPFPVHRHAFMSKSRLSRYGQP